MMLLNNAYVSGNRSSIVVAVIDCLVRVYISDVQNCSIWNTKKTW